MIIIKRRSRRSPVALLLWPLAALGFWSPSLIASDGSGVNAAVVGAPNDANADDFIQEFAEEINSEEFSDDMLDFILSSDAEILQAIEHRPLLDMLDDGSGPDANRRLHDVNSSGAIGMGNKTGNRVDGANQVKAAERHYE